MKKLSASVMLAAMLAVGGFAAPATAAPKSSDSGKSSDRVATKIDRSHTDAKDSIAIGYWPNSDDSSIMIGYWPN